MQIVIDDLLRCPWVRKLGAAGSNLSLIIAVRSWLGLQSSEGSSGARGSAPEVVGSSPMGLSTWLLECPHDTAASLPQSRRSERRRRKPLCLS